MRVTRNLRRLEIALEDLQCLQDTLVSSLRIIKVGIMLILLLLALILGIILRTKLSSLVRKDSPVEKTLEKCLLLLNRQKTEFENTSANILEVSCEVGMFSVRSSGTPGNPVSLFGSFLWSFGADQCASSEGFLVTFTPRGLEVICCDYPVLTENLFESFHFLKTLKGTSSALAYSRSGGQAIQDVPDSQVWEPDRLGAVGGNCQQRQMQPREYQDMISRAFSLVRLVRHNLMMTNPQGILVALNPTDEGRIGTGRNTWQSLDENALEEV